MHRVPHQLGELIQRYQDDIGTVSVYQRGTQRLMTFGNGVEQSCLDLAAPQRLEHAYTQAMMLGLVLLPDAAHTLLLGLGGGSLVHALHHVRPRMRIDAVEHRQGVIDAAQTHFAVQAGSKLHLHLDDATHFIASSAQRFELLMLDLYLSDGMHPAQGQAAFLRNCRDRLNDGGILVANHWSGEFHDSQRVQAGMREVFGESVLYLNVQGGNFIAFGCNGPPPRLHPKAFFALAQKLGARLDIDLQQLARNLWRQNAAILQRTRPLQPPT